MLVVGPKEIIEGERTVLEDCFELFFTLLAASVTCHYVHFKTRVNTSTHYCLLHAFVHTSFKLQLSFQVTISVENVCVLLLRIIPRIATFVTPVDRHITNTEIIANYCA